MMMNDLKFRSNARLVIRNNRKRPRRAWWALPLSIVAAVGLYAGLQANTDGHQQVVATPAISPLTFNLALPAKDSVATADTGVEPTAQIEPQPAALPSPVLTVAKAEQVQIDVAPVQPVQIEQEPAAIETPSTPEVSQTTSLPESEPVDRSLTYTIKAGDSLARIFKELGIPPRLLHRIVNSGKPAKQLARIKPGQILHIHRDHEEQLTELVYEMDPTKTLRVKQEGNEFIAKVEQREVESRKAEVSGIIEYSLFESAQKAGLSDTLTMKLAKIFGWDIDFALEIRSGDRFSVVYSEDWLDGEKLRDGPILAAEFTNKGKVHRAVRFEHAKGEAAYYTPDGKLMRKTFLRTPVKFSRISSKFTKRRWHPVLKRWRSHKGVDYAAPTGTPVKSAGAGKIAFIGRKGGYGKVIYVKHQGSYTTVYGHLSRFAKGIRKGKSIRQGQLIGYVGSTGLASGPHLHYEFRVNGKHKDPLKVTFAPAAPINKKYLPAFKKATRPLLAKLDNLNRTLVADAL